jgi:hypothetical protein
VFETLDVLPELTSRFELVIIDDCSTDATIEVADELAEVYPQLFVLRHAIPRGHAASIRTGIDHSLGEVIVFADADCPLPLNDVRQLWTALDEYDLAIGCRRGVDDVPGVLSSLDGPKGGYHMGYRRALQAVSDVLGQRTPLIARLQQCGVCWCEMRIGGGAPQQRHGISTAARPLGDDNAELSADRTIRTDLPETEPGRGRQPNFQTSGTKKTRRAGDRLYSAAKLVE